MISPGWKSAATLLNQSSIYSDLSAPIYLSPPEGVTGDQLALRRRYICKTDGSWLVWCELGPIICSEREQSGWMMRPDDAFAQMSEVEGEYRELVEWWAAQPPLREEFKTRREALAVLRSALAARSEMKEKAGDQ